MWQKFSKLAGSTDKVLQQKSEQAYFLAHTIHILYTYVIHSMRICTVTEYRNFQTIIIQQRYVNIPFYCYLRQKYVKLLTIERYFPNSSTENSRRCESTHSRINDNEN